MISWRRCAKTQNSRRLRCCRADIGHVPGSDRTRTETRDLRVFELGISVPRVHPPRRHGTPGIRRTNAVRRTLLSSASHLATRPAEVAASSPSSGLAAVSSPEPEQKYESSAPKMGPAQSRGTYAHRTRDGPASPFPPEPFEGLYFVTIDAWMTATSSSRSTTCRLIRDGKLDARKMGARTVILAASARAYLASLQMAPIGPGRRP
jgi:hypothetical protein